MLESVPVGLFFYALGTEGVDVGIGGWLCFNLSLTIMPHCHSCMVICRFGRGMAVLKEYFKSYYVEWF
jgi:hypothetical protein